MTTGLDRLLGRIAVRLESYGAAYRAERRALEFAKRCRVQPTTNLHPDCGVANALGNPDDIVFGDRTAVMGEFITFPQGGRIHVGDRTFVGPGTRVWSASSISIGCHVLIAHNVNIMDNVSHSSSWRERREEIDRILPSLALWAHDFDIKAGPLVIEDDVWIGFGASIIGGVRIGRGAIVGAGAMVTKDVEPFTVVVGNPVRVVRRLEGVREGE